MVIGVKEFVVVGVIATDHPLPGRIRLVGGVEWRWNPRRRCRDAVRGGLSRQHGFGASLQYVAPEERRRRRGENASNRGNSTSIDVDAILTFFACFLSVCVFFGFFLLCV